MAVEAAASSGPSVTPGLLGLGGHELDDLKQAADVLAPRIAKKPKLTHGLFFEDDRGLKKVIRDFPKLRFKGRGNEFDDLKVLIGGYKRWFKELYPFEDNFEDIVWKSRAVLQEKEKGEAGFESDPREQLHMLRYEYKNHGVGGTKAAAEAAARAKTMPMASAVPSQLSEEVRKRIEENKKKAMDLKRKRQEAAAAAAGPAPAATSIDDDEDVFGDGPGASAAPTFLDEEEDVFDFGGGLDDDDDFAPPARRVLPAPASAVPAPAAAPEVALDPEAAKRVAENRARAMEVKRKRQEGSAVKAAADAATAAKAAADAAAAKAATAGSSKPTQEDPEETQMDFQEEEDVFGFGGGLDDE
mmetsp:Transcript_2742/g.4172  ORF Transcript_2742/g.4172 Transcript_2742/m.4172 type:complete len:357 (-) Transcript_2742:182-1252(-)